MRFTAVDKLSEREGDDMGEGEAEDVRRWS